LKPAARVRPVGDSALSVELGEGVDPTTSARVRALDAALAREPLPGVLETVPTFRALLVLFDPHRVSADEVADVARSRLHAPWPEEPAPRRHEVGVRYGGEDGPDLVEAARCLGLDPRRVVELHTSREYTAFMLGFMPGFAYLGSLAPELSLPRRATPRPRVPAGSVAIAAGLTAVYPAATPGGWHLLGRAALRLFDPFADPPARIRPGDRVRFVAADEIAPLPPEPQAPPGPPAGAALLEVVDGGLLTTVQDLGRWGHRRWGVAGAGAMDRRAFAEANRIVGNPGGAAGLECTAKGPALRFLAPAYFSVTGADLGAVLHRADLGPWAVPLGVRVRAREGNVLALEGRRDGCRAYVALSGGLDVPLVLGSRSTDLPGRFGGFDGRPLRTGDRIGAGRIATPPPAPTPGAGPRTVDGVTLLRVVPGPQDDSFAPEATHRFLSAEYRVHATSDRVGCRLEGPPLTHAGPSEIVSDGMVPGCVQVPPDGQPIIMGPDSPTTGGYPKIATVITADREHLAQLLPGHARVRFEAVTVEQALRAMIAE
jgi:KipI family sensor histidine kinase inhibitor